MSTAADPASNAKRRWWNVIGPWPFRPVLMFVATWYFYNVTAVGVMAAGTELDFQRYLVEGVGQGFLSGLPVAVALWVGRRWQRNFGVHWGSYIAFIALAVAGAVVVRYVLIVSAFVQVAGGPSVFFAAFRIALLIFFTLAVAGTVTDRLQSQVTATQKALDESRVQQEQILRADEEARRQVADLLHDRVQAGLIAACLELQSLPDDELQKDTMITTIVHRLEELRGIDVKRAARALSPSLQDVDLHAALRELGAQYEPSVVTNVDVAADVERQVVDPEIRLGLYRITEQALMNSVAHGRAHHVDVSIRIGNDETVTWEVRDDGVGLGNETPQPGLGSALMTTWMRRLGGQWSLSARDAGGAVCRASIPLV